MQIHLFGGIARYEIENVCRLFLPHEPITLCDSPPAGEGVRVCAGIDGNTQAICRVMLGDFDRELRAAVTDDDPLIALWGKPEELTVATLLYTLLCELFSASQPWGLLTGVRPVKLRRRLTAAVGEEQALAYFRKRLLCSDEGRYITGQNYYVDGGKSL